MTPTPVEKAAQGEWIKWSGGEFRHWLRLLDWRNLSWLAHDRRPRGVGMTCPITPIVPVAQTAQGDWIAQAFTAQCKQGAIEVAGWVRGPFALDFRVYDVAPAFAREPKFLRAWTLSHVPTGRAICGIPRPLVEAQAIADEIAACGDWSFTDTEGSKQVARAFQTVRAKLNGALLFEGLAFAPFWAGDSK